MTFPFDLQGEMELLKQQSLFSEDCTVNNYGGFHLILQIGRTMLEMKKYIRWQTKWLMTFVPELAVYCYRQEVWGIGSGSMGYIVTDRKYHIGSDSLHLSTPSAILLWFFISQHGRSFNLSSSLEQLTGLFETQDQYSNIPCPWLWDILSSFDHLSWLQFMLQFVTFISKARDPTLHLLVIGRRL